MKENHLKQLLREKKPCIGAWLSMPSPFSAERVASLGFDWLVVDMEHNPISIETAAAMFMAINTSNYAAPMVRIPWNNGEHIKRVLDAGAWGIIVPMVNSRADAEAAVAAAMYPPKGYRSNGGGRYEVSFDASRAEYTSKANDEIVIVVQIEHIQAVERAEEILSVPGVDVGFIGPNDLMSSMGMIGKMDINDPKVVEAIDHVLKSAEKCGVAAGISLQNAQEVNARLRQGFRFLQLSSDMNMMMTALKGELSRVER